MSVIAAAAATDSQTCDRRGLASFKIGLLVEARA
jgi:hypothetical protein